jgi:hypothetical protein
VDGSNALLPTIITPNTNELGQAEIEIRSLTPGTFTENFKIQTYNWNDSYTNTSEVNDMYFSTSRENTF